MKHLFVPYEIAKQLKEKNFDDDCIAGYSVDESHTIEFLFKVSQVPIRKNSQMLYVLAPSYQQVLDWFRLQGVQIVELPNIELSKWEIYMHGESKGVHELNKAIEEALKLI